MKKFRWQLIIIFLTGLVVGILLLSEQPEVNQTVPEPAKGGNYTEALIGELQRLNPALDFYNQADRDVDRLLYSRLIHFDERGLPVGDLAQAWGISADGTIYNFALKSGVKWHDGAPLTSADIAFTVDLFRNGGEIVPQDLQEFWKNIEVVTLNETNLQFKLPEPFSPFLDYLTFGILPSHLLGGKTIEQIKDDPFNLQPVGSGSYRFERLLTKNNQITGVALTAFEDYYGQQPFIEQVIFRYYPDATAAMAAYRTDQVLGVSNVSGEALADALTEPDLALYTGRLPQMSMVLFNLKEPSTPYLQDKNVRLALYKAINRQYIVDRILDGQAILADGPIFPGTWAYFDGITRIEYDLDGALNLLKEAGYTLPAEGGTIRTNEEGTEFRFTLLYPDDEQHREIAETIQGNWQELDIQVDLEAVSYDALVLERLEERNFQAALVDLNLYRSPDPDPYPFWDQVQASGGQNYSQWDNRIASEYLETARTTLDVNERARLYRNFQVIFSEELPALPLYYPVYSYAVDRQVQGVSMGPLFDPSDRFATILDWFLIARIPTAAPAAATQAP
jgi:peptide/nickel transport system substrate-binding protein